MANVEILVVRNEEIRMRITSGHRVVHGQNHDKSFILTKATALFGRTIEVPVVDDTDMALELRWVEVSDWQRMPFAPEHVYCAEVPGGVLLVRDSPDSLAYWSGNSANAGIDVRLALGTLIGADGRVRRPMLNVRTGTTDLVSPEDLASKVVRVPD